MSICFFFLFCFWFHKNVLLNIWPVDGVLPSFSSAVFPHLNSSPASSHVGLFLTVCGCKGREKSDAPACQPESTSDQRCWFSQLSHMVPLNASCDILFANKTSILEGKTVPSSYMLDTIDPLWKSVINNSYKNVYWQVFFNSLASYVSGCKVFVLKPCRLTAHFVLWIIHLEWNPSDIPMAVFLYRSMSFLCPWRCMRMSSTQSHCT